MTESKLPLYEVAWIKEEGDTWYAMVLPNPLGLLLTAFPARNEFTDSDEYGWAVDATTPNDTELLECGTSATKDDAMEEAMFRGRAILEKTRYHTDKHLSGNWIGDEAYAADLAKRISGQTGETWFGNGIEQAILVAMARARADERTKRVK